MKLLKFKWFKGLIIVLLIIVVASFFANSFVKNKVEIYLAEELPSNIIHSHDDLQLSILRGNIEISNPKVTIIDSISGLNTAVVELKSLNIKNLSIFKLILNKDIDIREIKAVKPVVKIYSQQNKPKDSSDYESKKTFDNVLSLNRFVIEDAFIELIDLSKPNDSISVKLQGLNLMVENIIVDSVSVKESIPLKYEAIAIDSDSIYLNLGSYEQLQANDFSFDGKNLSLKNMLMNTKYSRKELSNIISKERDHFNIEVSELNATAMSFGRNDSMSVFNTSMIALNSPKILIYRDKLVNDDLSIKKMYGTMLRELPFELKIDSIVLKDGFLEYSERVRPMGEPGKIVLSKFNVNMSNVGNLQSSEKKTEINISTLFMDSAPMDFYWEFDSKSKSDAFIMRGDIGLLAANKLNVFTEPNVGVKLTGELSSTKFYINGDRTNSDVEFSLSYDDFVVDILQEDKKKNKFFSGLANVFVKNSSKKEKNNVVEKKSTVKRDQTKSVFNFLWLNVKEGLKDVMIGGGQKVKK